LQLPNLGLSMLSMFAVDSFTSDNLKQWDKLQARLPPTGVQHFKNLFLNELQI